MAEERVRVSVATTEDALVNTMVSVAELRRAFLDAGCPEKEEVVLDEEDSVHGSGCPGNRS